jgi:hypothetical protein
MIPARSGFRHNSGLKENPGPPHGPEQDNIDCDKPASRIGKHAHRVPP